MTFSTTKRFIAGVTCPKCAALDKVQGFSVDGVDFRACIACDYIDELRVNSPPREIQTRVNVPDQDPAQRVDPVKLVDPQK